VLATCAFFWCKKKKAAPTEEEVRKTFSESVLAMSKVQLATYRIHKNPEYSQILAEMRRMGKEKQNLKGAEKQLARVVPYNEEASQRKLEPVISLTDMQSN